MNQIIANLFVLAIVVVLVLLAMQAEPVTATLGFIIAAVLMLALITHVAKGK